ncbi:hypothetical protein [Nocardia brasiliensis]|uniref:VG15 protein n=1 Tax=Nocardia brasiliensis TaxID=37326 RepID=UPI0024584EAD|nr:hypothetical protein [Nocardia brasiliensis]
MTPGRYRLALDAIVVELTAVARPLVRLFLADPTPAARASLVELLLPHLLSARERAYQAGVQFLEAQRRWQGFPQAAVVPEIREYEPRFLDRAIVNALENYPNAAERALVGTVIKHAEQAARAVPRDSARLYNGGARSPSTAALTVLHDADSLTSEDHGEFGDDNEPHDLADDDDEDEDDELQADEDDETDEDTDDVQGWARILTGAESCAFCVTAAGRGAVYSTREDAIENASGEAYHVDCDCITVPVFDRDAWPGWAQARELEALYIQATTRYPDTPKLNAVRRLLAERGGPVVADLRAAA